MRLTSLLAQVLASTTLVSTTLVVACGGATVGVIDTEGRPVADDSRTPGTSYPTEPPLTPQAPPRTDAGQVDAQTDAGTGASCPKPGVLVRSGNDCSETWHLPCGIPADVHPEDGMSQEECNKVCGTGTPPFQYWGCNAYLQDDLPGPSFQCYTCVEGRRPQGYVDAPSEPTVAGWLAHAADLERVSIDAFQILRRELEHHDAPRDLVARAVRAEADEVRHAQVLGALALRAGATLTAIPVHHGPVRSLLDVALENAVEGCIRETYGALVAGYQADHATRTDVRRVMKQIYRDETTHAELAWSVHEWIMAQLSSVERAHVTSAMERAIEELALGAEHATPPELAGALGLPPAKDARRLVAGLGAQLWTPALAA